MPLANSLMLYDIFFNLLSIYLPSRNTNSLHRSTDNPSVSCRDKIIPGKFTYLFGQPTFPTAFLFFWIMEFFRWYNHQTARRDKKFTTVAPLMVSLFSRAAISKMGTSRINRT